MKIKTFATLGLLFLTAAEPTDKPAEKMDHGKPEPRFVKMHGDFMDRRSDKTRLLFLGASIAERWATVGTEAYKSHFAKYDVDDFGIGGDKTQNILWRIGQGELTGMDPKVVVIHTGNNNVEGDSVEDTARGMIAVVNAVHQKLPHARVILMAMFPRGADPEDPKVAALRAKIKKVNAIVTKLDDGDRTRVLDIGDQFLNPDGVIRYGMMNDAQHPTEKAYEIWGDAIAPTVAKMMDEPTTRP